MSVRPINPAVAAVAAPPIPAARLWANAYDGALGPVIDLTQAVPGYSSHPAIVDHLVAAARDPATLGYGDITGDLALREAFAAETNRIYGGAVGPDEVAITKGCRKADQVALYAFSHAAEVWWRGIETKLTRLSNLAVWRIPAEASQELATLAERSMQLQATIQEGVLMLANGQKHVDIEPVRWK